MFCKDCINIVCSDCSYIFSSNVVLLMDKSKNATIRKEPTNSFVCYIRKLYILFNLYQNEIIYKGNICKLFCNIVIINNVKFNYCGSCCVDNFVINFFVRHRLNSILCKDNTDTVSIYNNEKIKSRKLLKLKHI